MLKNRSYETELLDADNIPKKDLFQNLSELHTINKLLGGYKITFKGLSKILKKNKKTVIADIGSGGGDTLKEIYKWNKGRYDLKLFGIDLKQDCIEYSVSNNPNNDITFICDDYRNAHNHIEKIDILHACLFCHHLNENDIVDLIKFAQNHKITLLINDLERNPFAYYSIKILTRIFSKSYLVKNDAPLSVWRGFKTSEWKSMIKKSGAKNFVLQKKWAFRHLVIVYA
ncbi:MAG: methyltransferase domain-containing protein [Bacteroidia bacterium]|nr:methyltransferase domain-containing protein [Bacteroidia bacterium]